ncbi:Phosphoserine phosphatase RsbU [Actinomadura rubteroloni]|uniref:Phosphoserine phosphatase RsbU n=1 Tax=Actinomadura rubteroloni TaxID=1926885 RepID=A0A2P4UFA7_9ACTN|nr:PP2C family protein-serine/threonine phosphatase [Actinomadura rubteroloni]POM23750.1 Phosphoserine phosphatase RsbU [Actinomadura rubteroloni]
MSADDGTPPADEGSADARSADLSDLRGAVRDRALIAEARGALASRLGVPPGEALQHLIWLARDMDLELAEAAALVARAPGGEESTPDVPPTPAPEVEESLNARPPGEKDREEVLRSVTAANTSGDAETIAALPEDEHARAVLDATLDSAAHLVPVRRDDGRVYDFLYADLNDTARDLFGRGADELRGRRLLRMDPGTALSGLFDAFVNVLEKGEAFHGGPLVYSTAQEGVSKSSRMTVRVVRVPTGICQTWRYHFEEDRARRRLNRVERLGRLGFGEWDLISGEVEWSTQMAANYGVSVSEAPPSPGDLAKVVAPADIPLVEDALQTLFTRLEPVEVEHRVALSGGRYRSLWVFAEPVLDSGGLPVSVNIVSQDITRRRRIERALTQTRRQMQRQQARTAEQQRLAVTLRRAILPDDNDVRQLPGLRVAVRSLAAETAARIGGDWFATRELPDGTGLFAIGDVAGHGLPAAEAMARSRNGLLGLASTGEPPGRLVGWLNELVNDTEPTTGTALVGRYDPDGNKLGWASAGHLPPILLRGGTAVQLQGEPDPMLGAVAGVEYTTHEIRLYPDDIVFLYTDGLVERRDADLTDGINRLTDLLRESPADLAQVMDRALTGMRPDRSADDTTLFAVRVE